jgi:arginyl-tRNA synthetase
LNEEELLVLRNLVRFPEVVEMSAKLYSPNLLCNYLYDSAQKFNAFYNADKILGSENEEFRLALTSGVGQVLKNGLKLLGIETPKRM